MTIPNVAFDADVVRLATRMAGPAPAENLVHNRLAGELHALLALTDPIARHRAGESRIVTPQDDYVGNEKQYILGPFARPSASRFSDGSFGVLYAGLTFGTAREEAAYWTARFLAEAGMPDGTVVPKQHIAFRATSDTFADVRTASSRISGIYDRDDYAVSRQWGAQLRSDHDGVHYDSVRDSGGECIGAFAPRVASHVHLIDIIEFGWDGKRISQWKSVHQL